jgi:hypothetical protein
VVLEHGVSLWRRVASNSDRHWRKTWLEAGPVPALARHWFVH